MIQIPMSPGEVADRLIILNIKADHVSSPAKLDAVRKEWALVEQAWTDSQYASKLVGEAAAVWEDLAACNRRLWDLEDEVRSPMAQASREVLNSTYLCITYENGLRSSLKNRLNALLGSDAMEVKQHGKSR